ncbi:MAG: transporter [Sphingomonas bacterium]|nr:transporter [Sphingomonas bacterium]
MRRTDDKRLPRRLRCCCDVAGEKEPQGLSAVIRHTRYTAIIALPLILAGCDLAPRYQRPALVAPSTLPQGGPYPALSGTGTVAAVGWKDFFTDERLRQTIALGLANNRDLRIAAANVIQARAQYHVQRADLLPTITAGASASVRHTGTNGATVGSSGGTGTTTGGSTSTNVSSSGGTVDSYSADLGISAFELDLFGRVRNLTKAAQDQYFATQAGQNSTRISLIAEIATAWLTMASDEDQLAVSKDTLKSFQQSLDITRAQFGKGIISELDVRQAETNLQTARYDLAQLTSQIAQDQNALNLLVGTTVSAELLPYGLGGDAHTLSDLPAGLSSTVLLNRPDVLQAEDQLKAQNANIGAARAAFFPTISLTTAAGTASGGLSGLFTGGSWSYNASSSGLLTLFDFGRNQANLHYAQASRDAAVATYEKTVQTGFREVADALAQRGTIAEQIAARAALTDSAAKAAFLADARYKGGIDTYLNSLLAERTLYTARQSLVQTRLARASNLVELYRALGGGLVEGA